MFLMELGGLLIKKTSLLLLQALFALLGGLILAIYVALGLFVALVDGGRPQASLFFASVAGGHVEAVDVQHRGALGQQGVHEVRADEAAAAGDEDALVRVALHARTSPRRAPWSKTLRALGW
jgi:hypothetical protein